MALGMRSQPSHHAITINRPSGEVGAAFDVVAARRHFVPLSVTVTPAPMDRGTEVHVRVDDAGLGHLVRAIRGESRDQRARQVLRELKAELECGQALRVEPQPDARGEASRAWQRVISDRLAKGGRR